MRRFHHGSNSVIYDINLNICRSRTDFGKGFYMGNNLGEARKWAISQSMATETPIVMRYVLNDSIFNFSDRTLKRLWFSTPTVAWLNFVRDNRRLIDSTAQCSEPRHSFDIVYGPIADDKVVDVVDDYIDGLITDEEAILRVKVIPSVFQISFHTPLALCYIDQTQTDYQQRVNGSIWSAWENVK